MMNIDGQWKLTAKSPMGLKTDDLEFKTIDGKLTGTQISEGLGTHRDLPVKVDGDTISWSVPVTKPMKLTLEFKLQVDGDSMSGTVKAGIFGNAPVTVVRA